MTLPVEITVHRPMMMLVDEPSRPDCEAEERMGRRSPRSCTSAIMTVRPPSWMLAVPVMAARRETLLPESCDSVRNTEYESVRSSKSSGMMECIRD